MNITTFCIKRPAFTLVISLVMMIIGTIGFLNLPIRWIPKVNSPEITIETAYAGASAKLVENDVTKVIEESLSGINGVEALTSSSRQGFSQINLSFKLGSNVDAAVEDIRSSIERVRDVLPKDITTPTVVKADKNNMPILYVSFFDANRDEREMSDYIDKYLLPSFQTIDGVGSVEMYGKRLSAMKISLDPSKMAASNVTVDEVSDLLRSQNASIPSGQIKSQDRSYSVIADTHLKTADQFNNLIIRDHNNQMVRIKDIGNAQLEAENTDQSFRIDGKSAIALGIIPQSNANPLEVEQRIQGLVKNIAKTLPRGMQVDVVYNQADYIRSSIKSVYESFFEAILFVWIIIFIFLCNLRATLIPIITVPVCLIATFSILYVMGFSINTITLMAFVLAIGLVVDDAIVMLENISRHIEAGMTPFEAAIKGSKEIVFPIIAMTLTLAAVFAPIAFTPGLLGVLFREFTFTLAGAVIISGIVALTLSPMMCARLLTSKKMEHRYALWISSKITLLQGQYQRLLSFILVRKKWVIALLALIGAMGYGIYSITPSELAPAEDMNEIDVFVSAPKSASFQYTDGYVKQLEQLFKETPDIESYLSAVGTYSSSHSFHLLKIKPRGARSQSIEKILAALTEKASRLPGVRINISLPPPALAEFAGGDEGDNIGMVIMTSSDYRNLQDTTKKVMDALKNEPGFLHVDNRLKWDSEQFQLTIDRDRAADLKLSIPNITNTLSTLIAGRSIGKADDANIILQMNKSAQGDPNIFESLYARNDAGVMIPLSSVINVNMITSPEVFHRYERLRADTIYLTLAPNYNIAKAIKNLNGVAKTLLPYDMKYTFTGEAKSYLESNGKTFMTFALALIFIYLVLVAQFESFIDPFIILLTVPFAMIGAIATLKLFGGTLNIYSEIGLITLIGLIAKHGILITDFANRRRLAGLSIHDAIIESCLLRLRPILMTTAAMILGALPLALAFGPGAESRQQVGLVVAGGLFFGTFFSLVVVPIAYVYFSQFKNVQQVRMNDAINL